MFLGREREKETEVPELDGSTPVMGRGERGGGDVETDTGHICTCDVCSSEV